MLSSKTGQSHTAPSTKKGEYKIQILTAQKNELCINEEKFTIIEGYRIMEIYNAGCDEKKNTGKVLKGKQLMAPRPRNKSWI